MKAKYYIILTLVFYSLEVFSQIKTVQNTFYGCAPATLKFYTVSPKAGSDIWDFDNGSQSSADSPTITFINDGTYNVTVGSLTQQIVIYTNITPFYTATSPVQGCLPFTFSLKDATTYAPGVAAVSWKWLFSDGSTATGNPITHTIANHEPNSDVRLTLTINPSSCNASTNFPNALKMIKKPVAAISASPLSACRAPITVNFTNNSSASIHNVLNYEWRWNGPNAGSSTAFDLNPMTITTQGIYQVILKVTNQYGCYDEDTVNIAVQPLNLDFIVPDTLCVQNIFSEATRSQAKMLFHTPNTSYTISSSTFQSTGFINDSTIEFTVLDRPSGLYDIKITKTSLLDGACVSSLTKQIFIINHRPDLVLKRNPTCKMPINDSFFFKNLTKLVDSIKYDITYSDKYGMPIKKFQKTVPKKDSILVANIDYFDFDSVYRKGDFQIFVALEYFHGRTGCNKKDTLFQFEDPRLFYGFIESNKTKGCTPLKVRMEAHSYYIHEIDSVIWDFGDGVISRVKVNAPYIIDSPKHIYTSAGKYRVFAIMKSRAGCIDTTNPIWITVNDTMIPRLILDKTQVCLNESVRISKVGDTVFDRLFFVTDDFKSINCPKDTTVLWPKFNRTGKHYVYLYGDKGGCKQRGVDSINVLGPSFYLDYDFNCSRRDSVLFIIKNQEGINPKQFYWYFGHGTSYTNSNDSMWHKFPSPHDYKVLVSSVGSLNGCSHTDSTTIQIRKVKALFTDTLFCKQKNPTELFNDFPYILDPSKSSGGGYFCNYTYTWLMDSAGIKKPPITQFGAVEVDLPFDTFNLTLVARDINGCEDRLTKQIIVSDNHIDFTLDKPKYCRPSDSVIITNLSKSPFGLKEFQWTLSTFKNGQPNLVKYDTARHLRMILAPGAYPTDSFIINLKITDSNNCKIKEMFKYIVFHSDTSKLVVKDTICQNTGKLVSLDSYNKDSIEYRWRVNNLIQPAPDTTNELQYNFNTPGLSTIMLLRKHRYFNCVDSFDKQVYVNKNLI